jgi:hypothetical protein
MKNNCIIAVLLITLLTSCAPRIIKNDIGQKVCACDVGMITVRCQCKHISGMVHVFVCPRRGSTAEVAASTCIRESG